MKLHLRLRRDMHEGLLRALTKPHAFALERVAFAFGRRGGDDLILLSSFIPVADGNYVDDPTVGARINAQAIHEALQHAYSNRLAAFHTHMHEHRGAPRFSPTDRRELPDVMLPFQQLIPHQPHGLFLLSEDDATGACWWPGAAKAVGIKEVTVVGSPMRLLRGERS